MDVERAVVLIPGANYGVDCPLLFYARLAASRRGARIVPIAWSGPCPEEGYLSWVREQVAEAVGDTRPLLIGKSLGTLAAGLAADLGLPAVWLTPLFTQPSMVHDLGRAAAPALLVGGTADGSWDGDAARALSPHVLEIPDADHILHVPGDVAATTRVAGLVADAVERFLDEVIWPL